MGATGKSGAKAKAGLVRAVMADKGWEADARHWPGRVSREYRMLFYPMRPVHMTLDFPRSRLGWTLRQAG